MNWDYEASMWSVKSGDCLSMLTGHSEIVNCFDISPRGSQIATGSSDNTIRLWSTETKECCRVLTGHYHPIVGVAYSPGSDVQQWHHSAIVATEILDTS